MEQIQEKCVNGGAEYLDFVADTITVKNDRDKAAKEQDQHLLVLLTRVAHASRLD